jgi:hypothetical protein
MANKLTLVQVSPPSNPDRMICSVAVSGDYTSGTPDPLPLGSIADPSAIGAIPMPGVGTNPPPSPPRVFGFMNGYYAQVEETVAEGQTSYGLRWYAPGGGEVATGAFPGGLTGGLQLFVEILVDLATQS